MEFMLAIMAALQERPDAAMSDVVGEIYHKTIHRWHGFLTSSAFTVAFAFVPSREAFLNRLAGGKYCGRTAADMAAYVDQFSALLAEVHKFLDKHGLDDPRRV
ncbi:hypothetical protein MNEG_15258 [Monoraphidium neglectum]|uniref:Glycolipid transfer protein domain-containing protein n=1 Tax=Monoraphidium neglectum TaxID=145388 RepID=A0A0D2MBJ6_9CHLO|nr:hypothetical protein MNEG_15258 [Monoraphidium neglectum]KIY92705.1 hypothetical protein MNEG_15258 [Monoraphidium neglectum]|eukprot:XP_013891725.1 hypothetical protein MNEG_15258 [Monoraphidium neglectum]